MPEFKDGFQNSLNTLRYCQKWQLSRTTEKIKTMVMAKQRFNKMFCMCFNRFISYNENIGYL